MKALEKDRTRRYASAAAFAADVVRYLHDEPVAACAPSTWYRARKFMRRNRTQLRSVGLVLVLAAAVLAVAVGWVAHEQAARRADGEQRAQAMLNDAGRLLDLEQWHAALAQCDAILYEHKGGAALRRATAQLRRHVHMAQKLEEARLGKSAIRDEAFDLQGGDAAYAEAFAWYALDVDALAPQQATEQVRASPICRQLSAALDDWSYSRKRLGTDGWQRRLVLARAADPDHWRNRLRDALESADAAALAEVLQSARPDDWPAATFVLLSELAEGTPSAEQASTLLRRGQHRHPTDFWINYRLGRSLLQLQPPRYDGAAHFFSIAVGLRPQSPRARLEYGYALARQGNHEEAIAQYRRGIELQPDLPMFHNNLGWSLEQLGKPEIAIPAYRAAIGLHSRFDKAHFNYRALVARRGKLLEEAIPFYSDELARRPGCAALWRGRAECYYELRDYGHALADLGTSLELRPDDAEVCYWIAWLLGTTPDLRLRDPGRAVELAGRAVALAPTKGPHWLALALANYRQGNWQAALDAVEKATCMRGGGDSTDHFLLAMVHWRLGHRDQAPDWFAKGTQGMLEHQHDDWARFRAEAASLLGLPLVEIRSLPYWINEEPWSINVIGVAISADGRRVLAGGDHKEPRVYDVDTGQEVRRLTGHTDWVPGVALSADGRRALTGSNDRTVRLWDVDTGKELRRAALATPTIITTFAPDGRQALSVHYGERPKDHVIRLWHVDTWTDLRALTGHTGQIWSAEFSPDSRNVLSTSADRTIRLWDVETGKEIRRFSNNQESRCACFAPDGRTALATCSDEVALRVWDVATGNLLRRVGGEQKKDPKTWSALLQAAMARLAGTAPAANEQPGPPGCVAFLPDGRRAIAGYHFEGKMCLSDIESGTEVFSVRLAPDLRLNRLAVSADGRRIASANWRGSVTVWQVTDPAPPR
jgi:WD40 repeat protein/tetratricopeptide (TPR) repeat protein